MGIPVAKGWFPHRTLLRGYAWKQSSGGNSCRLNNFAGNPHQRTMMVL